MWRSLSSEASSKILLLIGDEGASVLYFRNGTIDSRFFLSSPGAVNADKLKNILREDKEAQVYLLLEHLDQAYEPRMVPITNPLGVERASLAQLNKELPEAYLRTAQKIKKFHANINRDWLICNIYTPYESPIANWIEFLLPFPNLIMGIYFMPLEAGNIFVSSRTADETLEPSWHIVIFRTRASGYRISVYYNDKIAISRIINPKLHEIPEVSAGNLEMEVNNTIDYLKKTLALDELKVSLTLLLNDEIAPFIRLDKLESSSCRIMTPAQLSKQLGYEHLIAETEKFLDHLLLAEAASKKLQRAVHTPQTHRQFKFATYTFWAARLSHLASALVITMSLYLAFESYGKIKEINSYRHSLSDYEAQLRSVRSKAEILRLSVQQPINLSKVSEIVDLYIFLTKNNVSPIDQIRELGKISGENALSAYKWEFNDPMLLITNGALVEGSNIRADRVYTLQSSLTIPVAADVDIKLRGEAIRAFYAKAFPELTISVSNYMENDSSLQNTSSVIVSMSYSPLSKLENLEVYSFSNKGRFSQNHGGEE